MPGPVSACDLNREAPATLATFDAHRDPALCVGPRSTDRRRHPAGHASTIRSADNERRPAPAAFVPAAKGARATAS